jgi:hypothetical protein
MLSAPSSSRKKQKSKEVKGKEKEKIMWVGKRD